MILLAASDLHHMKNPVCRLVLALTFAKAVRPGAGELF